MCAMSARRSSEILKLFTVVQRGWKAINLLHRRHKNSNDDPKSRRNRDDFQARAVNNRSNNLANQEAESNKSNQSEAAQSKIQQLEKRTEENDKVMRALNERVNQLQMQPSVPFTPVQQPAIPMQIPIPVIPPPIANIGMNPQGPTSANVYGYQPLAPTSYGAPPINTGVYTNTYQNRPLVGGGQNAPNSMGRGGAGRGTPPQCYGCGNFGHIKRNCPTPVGYGSNNSPPSNQGNQPLQNMMLRAGKHRVAVVQCFGCGSYGHVRKDCVSDPRPSPLMETKGGQIYNGQNYANPGGTPRGNDQTVVKCQEVGADGLRKNKSYLEIEIGGNKHMCLLDSGSDVTIVPMSIVHGRRLTRTTQKLFAAGGHKLPLSGTTTITMKIGDQTLETEVLVSKHIDEVMLGLDWLVTHNVQWQFGAGTVGINKQQFLLHSKHDVHRCRRLVTTVDTWLEPNTETLIPAEYKLSGVYSEQLEDRDWAIEPLLAKPDLLVAGALLPKRCDGLPVRMINVSKEGIFLKKGSEVAEATPVEVQEKIKNGLGTEKEPGEFDHVDPLVDEITPDASDDR